MEKSLWYSQTTLPSFPTLKGNHKTDVLIIGGGMCGLLCGYYLKQSGIDCTIVESRKIASGTSGNTTSKITSLHGTIYGNLMGNLGLEAAQKYFDINEKAIKEYEKIAKEVSCDFKKSTAYTYTVSNKQIIQEEYLALKKLGAAVEFKVQSRLPISVSAMVALKNQAEFNPLKFIKHIIKDQNIYEDTRILDIDDNIAYYDGGKIRANKIIVTTHFPFIDRHGLYFLKLYQHRSYVLALENAQNVCGMYVDEAEDGLSFRNYGDLLLLGGGGGRTGKACGGFNELERFKEKHYPKAKIKYKWATQDCMSLDKIPLIGQYSKATPNMFVATGFNKWGMTSSMVAAMLLTDMIKQTKNEYADIFCPSRSILKPQLFVNILETLSNFVVPTTKRCSHLGCALKWNKYEHSWDCACHGSRFTADGKVINNPANKDIK